MICNFVKLIQALLTQSTYVVKICWTTVQYVFLTFVVTVFQNHQTENKVASKFENSYDEDGALFFCYCITSNQTRM